MLYAIEKNWNIAYFYKYDEDVYNGPDEIGGDTCVARALESDVTTFPRIFVPTSDHVP